MNIKSFERRTLIRYGLFYGLFMFTMMGVLFPLAKDEKLTSGHLVVSFVVWMVGGFVVGWITVKSKSSKSQKSK